MRILYILLIILFSTKSRAQSFNDDKTSFINYLKRMYNTSPFDGAKHIEGSEGSSYIAAISLTNNLNYTEINSSIAKKEAQNAAKITFAEPCVRFEMLSTIIDKTKNNTTYSFSCQLISDFVKSTFKKQPFNDAKIIATPNFKYFISVVYLETQKYTSESLIDRVALIKAKQQVNKLFNGSIISSNVIIKTDVASRYFNFN